MDAIDIGGSRYIKADDAARLTGYATDYIGQLSRSRKISAKRIGRMWYVSQDDVVAHKNGRSRSNKLKTREALHQKIQEVNPGQIHYATLPSFAEPDTEARRRVMEASISYERDASPLTPVFEEKAAETESESNTEAAPDIRLEDAPYDVPDETVALEEPSDETFAVSVRKMDVEEVEDEGFDAISNSPHVAVAVRQIHHSAPARPKILAISPLTHIPRPSKALVAAGNPSYALGRPFIRALVPIAVVLGFIFSLSNVFFEQVLVYERGESLSALPYYQMSYGLTAISSVQEGISGISFDFLSSWLTK